MGEFESESQLEETRRNRSRMELNTGFGKLNISGDILIVVAILMILIGGMGYVMRMDHDAQAKMNDTLTKEMKELSKEARIQNWLLAQPPSDRPQLRTPIELWDRLAPGEYYKFLQQQKAKEKE